MRNTLEPIWENFGTSLWLLFTAIGEIIVWVFIWNYFSFVQKQIWWEAIHHHFRCRKLLHSLTFSTCSPCSPSPPALSPLPSPSPSWSQGHLLQRSSPCQGLNKTLYKTKILVRSVKKERKSHFQSSTWFDEEGSHSFLPIRSWLRIVTVPSRILPSGGPCKTQGITHYITSRMLASLFSAAWSYTSKGEFRGWTFSPKFLKYLKINSYVLTCTCTSSSRGNSPAGSAGTSTTTQSLARRLFCKSKASPGDHYRIRAGE